MIIFNLFFLDICGIEGKSNHKIVGGSEAQPHQFPWLVALFANSWFCSASLLSEEWVLTAAHCVDGATRSVLKHKTSNQRTPIIVGSITIRLVSRFGLYQTRIYVVIFM